MGARPKPAFVAVSANPAIDRVARIEGPARGLTRATEYVETPGGKAIHAACVAAELGAGAGGGTRDVRGTSRRGAERRSTPPALPPSSARARRWLRRLGGGPGSGCWSCSP